MTEDEIKKKVDAGTEVLKKLFEVTAGYSLENVVMALAACFGFECGYLGIDPAVYAEIIMNSRAKGDAAYMSDTLKASVPTPTATAPKGVN